MRRRPDPVVEVQSVSPASQYGIFVQAISASTHYGS